LFEAADMRRKLVRLVLLFNILFLCFGAASAQGLESQPADTVVLNARVYTVNPKQPWAEALAIRGDKIVAVGSAKEMAPYRAASTKVIDAGGRLVLPGFTDSHIHLL
jgi:imidazolonepropionase-like amidohydrolase